ncbi:MAG: response regulator [Bacteroidales bacterium]|nr:response regulator [Bacteroidales bacterium]
MASFRWYRGLIILLFIHFPLFVNGNSPDYIFKQIFTEQGLPGAYIRCIFQDSKGLMWFGIGSVGLCKYDGENFTVYERSDTDSNTISNNSPVCIVEDKTGNLWIGTTEGLNKFDREKGVFTGYFYSPSSDNCIPNNYINDLHIDTYNNIWIATKKGISKYDSKRNIFYNLLTGEEGDDDLHKAAIISSFYEDENGNIWVGTYSNGLFLIDQETNLRHTNDNRNRLTISKHWLPIDKNDSGLPNYAIQEICKFNEHNLLIGKVDGLFLFDISTGEFTWYAVHSNPLLNYKNVSTLCRDSYGIIWVGYATEGIVKINPATNEQIYFDAKINVPGNIQSNTIRDIFEDKSGLIWIGTKFQGLHTYDRRQEMFKNHTYNAILNEELRNSFILSLMEDSKNNIWIGTKSEGIYQFNPKTEKISNYKYLSSIPTRNVVGNNRIECIIEDISANIYFGTENGVKKFDYNGSGFGSFTLPNYYIRCMTSDKYGNLWVGTNNSGIFYYEAKSGYAGRYKSTKEQEFFANNEMGIIATTITDDSLLWISTLQDGLYKYNIQKDILSHYLNDPEDSTSISGNMVRDVFMDSSGKIWIGTESSGLNIYNSQSDNFIRIDKANGLPPNSIYSILQDKKGNMWMGSHEGIFTIDKETGSFSLFNNIYGLKSNVFEVNAKCITRDGLVIFGGSEGLNVFDPANVHKQTNEASLIISSIKVYDETIAEDISDYTELSISYSEKYISIGFALTDYSDPGKIKYKYMLENFNEDWIECGNRNYANYTALPPGKYQFIVMAANSDNVWIDKPLTIKLTITSPLWRKPLFIAGCVILLILFIFIVYIARIRFLRKNEMKLKELVAIKTQDLMELNMELEEAKEKAEESDRLKSAFIANISHEIRTPMNGIRGFATLLEKPELTSEKQKIYLDIIRVSSDRMLRIINDLIDISIIEAGQIKVNKEQTNVNTLMEELFTFYKPLTDKKGLELKYYNDLAFEESYVEADKGRLYQVLGNLLDNAIKKTSSGLVTFGYQKKPAAFEFYVKDTGVGIPPELVNTIFERFRQVENPENTYRQGSGLGLSISKALVESHGGRIWVDSTPGKGSTFYFTIPCKTAPKKNIEPQNKSSKNDFSNLIGKKILIVEDDVANYIYIQEILENAGMKIFLSENGAEAVEFVSRNTDIDIILMDMKMPVMDGLEATKRIKEKYSHIPIIMQTAFAQTDDRQMAINGGCDDYISKPFNIDELLELINKYACI